MKNIKRRAAIKSLGALSLGVAAPKVSQADVLVEPYKTNEKELETDILIVGGGTANIHSRK